jgi:hypothetical protein
VGRAAEAERTWTRSSGPASALHSSHECSSSRPSTKTPLSCGRAPATRDWAGGRLRATRAIRGARPRREPPAFGRAGVRAGRRAPGG